MSFPTEKIRKRQDSGLSFPVDLFGELASDILRCVWNIHPTLYMHVSYRTYYEEFSYALDLSITHYNSRMGRITAGGSDQII